MKNRSRLYKGTMRILPLSREFLLVSLKIVRNQRAAVSSFGAPSDKLNAISLKNNETNYLRSVLAKCDGCILFEPVNKLNIRSFLLPSENAISTTKVTSKTKLFEDELIQKLTILARPGITPDPSEVSQLERQCLKEYESWPDDKQLLVLDMWHHIPEGFHIKFIWSARNRLLNRIRDLSSDHALQTLYYAIWLRQRMSATQQKSLQNRFMEEIDSMTLEMMSVWCLAMFRNQATISSRKLIEEIYSKLLQNDLKKFHEIGLASVLKVRILYVCEPTLVSGETRNRYFLFADDSPLIDGISGIDDDATSR